VGPDEPVRTRVRVQTGEVVVIVPADMDVRVHCHADAGDVDCLGVDGRPESDDDTEGPSADARVDNLGADAARGGRVLELDVSVGVGQVEVRRAGEG
jgi:predicted membrane protein